MIPRKKPKEKTESPRNNTLDAAQNKRTMYEKGRFLCQHEKQKPKSDGISRLCGRQRMRCGMRQTKRLRPRNSSLQRRNVRGFRRQRCSASRKQMRTRGFTAYIASFRQMRRGHPSRGATGKCAATTHPERAVHASTTRKAFGFSRLFPLRLCARFNSIKNTGGRTNSAACNAL